MRANSPITLIGNGRYQVDCEAETSLLVPRFTVKTACDQHSKAVKVQRLTRAATPVSWSLLSYLQGFWHPVVLSGWCVQQNGGWRGSFRGEPKWRKKERKSSQERGRRKKRKRKRKRGGTHVNTRTGGEGGLGLVGLLWLWLVTFKDQTFVFLPPFFFFSKFAFQPKFQISKFENFIFAHLNYWFLQLQLGLE